jgi:hypothetical protein
LIADYATLKCSAFVSGMSGLSNKIILGDTFIRNFYLSFDYSTYEISIAPSANPPTFYTGLSGWAIFGIVFACLVVFVGSIIAIACLHRRK